MRGQARRFRYVINAEGHGGWADRLYYLLLSPMTVVAQDDIDPKKAEGAKGS